MDKSADYFVRMLESQRDTSGARFHSGMSRIVGWLALGHAAALVLVLKSVLESPPCISTNVAAIAAPFEFGLAFAFVAALLDTIIADMDRSLADDFLSSLNRTLIAERLFSAAKERGDEDAAAKNEVELQEATKSISLVRRPKSYDVTKLGMHLAIGAAALCFEFGVLASEDAVRESRSACAAQKSVPNSSQLQIPQLSESVSPSAAPAPTK